MYIRIKELRESYKLSQKEIADYLNISTILYKSYETGKKKIPVHIIFMLSQKYNTSIDYIVGDTDVAIPHTRI